MTESSKLERLTLWKRLEDVFDQVEEDDADPSLLWVILTTGSIILSTLTYVGFRKYKAEEDRRRKEKRLAEIRSSADRELLFADLQSAGDGILFSSSVNPLPARRVRRLRLQKRAGRPK
ncbi:sporulation protein YpjB [Bacillus licheniformis]|nr:sporulation protein YpjB [Bacillus licheniformis]